MTAITKTVKLYLHAAKYNNEDYICFAMDMSEYGYPLISIKEVSVTFDVSNDLDVSNLEINSLTKTREKIKSVADREIKRIDDKITMIKECIK